MQVIQDDSASDGFSLPANRTDEGQTTHNSHWINKHGVQGVPPTFRQNQLQTFHKGLVTPTHTNTNTAFCGLLWPRQRPS